MEDRRQKQDRREGEQAIFPKDDRTKDRRQKERRTKDRIPVKMWVTNIDGEATYFQQTGNLSTNGMYLMSPFTYPKNTVIKIEFQIPGEETIVSCDSLVVNVTAEDSLFGLSVKFHNISEKDHKAVKDAVDRLLCDYWYMTEE